VYVGSAGRVVGTARSVVCGARPGWGRATGRDRSAGRGPLVRPIPRSAAPESSSSRDRTARSGPRPRWTDPGLTNFRPAARRPDDISPRCHRSPGNTRLSPPPYAGAALRRRHSVLRRRHLNVARGRTPQAKPRPRCDQAPADAPSPPTPRTRVRLLRCPGAATWGWGRNAFACHKVGLGDRRQCAVPAAHRQLSAYPRLQVSYDIAVQSVRQPSAERHASSDVGWGYGNDVPGRKSRSDVTPPMSKRLTDNGNTRHGTAASRGDGHRR
jgi:hypothetical protein